MTLTRFVFAHSYSIERNLELSNAIAHNTFLYHTNLLLKSVRYNMFNRLNIITKAMEAIQYLLIFPDKVIDNIYKNKNSGVWL